MSRLRDILRSDGFRRATIGLYALLLAAVVGVYIGISLLDVKTSTYIRGDATLEKGRPNAVRGVVQNARTGKPRRHLAVRFYLVEPDDVDEKRDPVVAPPEGTVIGRVQPGGDGVLQTSLKVPDSIEPGTYELVLRAEGTDIEPFEAQSRVSVTEPDTGSLGWPEKTTRLVDEKRREKFASGAVDEQAGALAIDVLPRDGEVPRGLPDRVFLRTYDAESGEPVPAEIRFTKVEAMGQWGKASEDRSTLETDALGLVEVPIEAVGGQKWHLAAEEVDAEAPEDGKGRSGTATVTVHTVPSQIALAIERQLVGGGGVVVGEALCLFRAGELLVDTYRNDDWLQAEDTRLSRRKSTLRLELPRDDAADGWLYRIQVSRGFYDAGQAWDSEYVVKMGSGQRADRRAALLRLAGFIAEHADDPYFEHLQKHDVLEGVRLDGASTDKWVGAFLEAVPRRFARPGTLFNSESGDEKDLEAWKDRVQSDLMIVIAVALAAGLAVVLYVVIVGLRRMREHRDELRRIDDELAAGGAEFSDGDEEDAYGTAGERDDLLTALLGFIALATFVMFALGLLVILSYL